MECDGDPFGEAESAAERIQRPLARSRSRERTGRCIHSVVTTAQGSQGPVGVKEVSNDGPIVVDILNEIPTLYPKLLQKCPEFAHVLGRNLQTGIVLTTSYSGLGTAEIAARQLCHSFNNAVAIRGHHSGIVMHSATDKDKHAQQALLAHSQHFREKLQRRPCCESCTNQHLFADILERLVDPEPLKLLQEE
eukprot:3547040-Amphidinium_carterae.1